MPRNKAIRTLNELPVVKGFRPLWLRQNYRQAVTIQLEEYESLRLIDYENLTQEQAAERMNVSRPTVTRIYEQARKKVTQAIVEGRSFFIEGGEIELRGEHYFCEKCRHKFIFKKNEKIPEVCPECGSPQLLNLGDCFIRGCGRCRRCR